LAASAENRSTKQRYSADFIKTTFSRAHFNEMILLKNTDGIIDL